MALRGLTRDPCNDNTTISREVGVGVVVVAVVVCGKTRVSAKIDLKKVFLIISKYSD